MFLTYCCCADAVIFSTDPCFRTRHEQIVAQAAGHGLPTIYFAREDARLGAALAYYSVFSRGPLIVIAIAVAGLLFGQEAVREEVAGGSRNCWARRGRRLLKQC